MAGSVKDKVSGNPLMVVRPDKPEAVFRAVVHDGLNWAKAIEAHGGATVVGYLTTDSNIVDGEGKVAGKAHVRVPFHKREGAGIKNEAWKQMENGNRKTVSGLDVFIPPWFLPREVIVGEVKTAVGWILTTWDAFTGRNRGPGWPEWDLAPTPDWPFS